MTLRTVLRNATLFDSRTATLVPGTTIVVGGDRFEHVATSRYDAPADATVLDLQGRVVLPGLIDAHVHVTATSTDFLRLSMTPQSLITAQAKDLLHAMLMRGFTTARDAAGADAGLAQAVARGHFIGPRLFVAGRGITQTGGHGDVRPSFYQGGMQCGCCGHVGLFGSIADGVGDVRRAVREELRNGANHIKVMAGGGVTSPNDPLDGIQYSIEEMTAIVEEARAARKYVMAHAYTPEAIVRAVRCGVRTIEHGNLLDAPTAAAMAEHGAFLVPTLATFDALTRNGPGLGWSEEMLAKLQMVNRKGVEAIRIARAAGVRIGYGTDLVAEMHVDQSIGLILQSEAMPAAEVLRSATWVNAELMGQSEQLGVVAPGAYADLVVVDGNPVEELGLLQQQGRHLPAIMKGGVFHKNELSTRHH